MNILITGACGYVGSSLTPYLLSQGHNVRAVDTEWFGNNLDPHPNLEFTKKDIRDLDETFFQNIESVIHLANIANDPSVDLNPNLSWEVNVLATQKLADNALRAGVQQLIYASSGSVYGVKDELDVTEDLELVPISVYNKTKMVSERVTLSYKDSIKIHNIRPATVCGWSPRMRLDVSVNMFVFQALKFKSMSIFGGEQIRPNIHIQDLINVYKHFIFKPNLPAGFYNAGFENLKILDIAKKVAKIIPAKIIITKRNNDPRSYRQNSDKLFATGFKKKFSVSDAIKEIKTQYENKKFTESDKCYTVKWMKKLDL